jgi:hypothetical protein
MILAIMPSQKSPILSYEEESSGYGPRGDEASGESPRGLTNRTFYMMTRAMNTKRLLDITIGAITGFVAALLLSGGNVDHQRPNDGRTGRSRLQATAGPSNGHSNGRQPNPQLSQPSGVEKTDGDIGLALETKLSKGEYVNTYEYPNRWKQRKELIQEHVQELAARNRTNLVPVFRALGLPDSTSELLQQHVSKINEAAIEVNSMMWQLEEARSAYDNKMRVVLTPADYERYKVYEASGPARRTYEKITDFAKGQHRVLPESERENVIAIIRDAEAYVKDSYLGPYDGLPTVAIGKEKVVRNSERRLAEIEDGANRALEMAVGRGLSEDAIQILYDYYDEDSQRRRAKIERYRDPQLEERMAAYARGKVEEMTRAQDERGRQ